MFLASEFWTKMFQLYCFAPLVCVFVMDGLWSHPCEFPRVPNDEEIDGDLSLIGPGGLSGYGVDGDNRMFGPGRPSSYRHAHEDMNDDGLGQAMTPFVGGEVHGGLGSGGPISLVGNMRRTGHRGDPTIPLSPPSPPPNPPPSPSLLPLPTS